MQMTPSSLKLEDQYVELFGDMNESITETIVVDPNNLAQPSPFSDVDTYVTYGTTENTSDHAD